MDNFQKCTVAMLGWPCSQHVTGKTSELNQPQSAIMRSTVEIMQQRTLVARMVMSVTSSWSDSLSYYSYVI